MSELLDEASYAGISEAAAERSLSLLGDARRQVAAAAAARDAADAVRAAIAAMLAKLGIPHAWNGTKLSLRLPDGSYGEEVDLRGQRGDPAPLPLLVLGLVSAGDDAGAVIHRDPNDETRFIIDLTLPRGRPGSVGGINPVLQAIATLQPDAGRFPVFTAPDKATLTAITSFGRGFLELDKPAAKALLGISIADVPTLEDRLHVLDGSAEKVASFDGIVAGHTTSLSDHAHELATHAGEIDDLQTADGARLVKARNLDDLLDAGTARSNLGLAFASEDDARAATKTSGSMTPQNVGQSIRALAVMTCDTAAMLPALNRLVKGGEVVTLRGYNARGDGGGGDLIYDPVSDKAANGGTVFGFPQITGRFTRPVDGFLHTKWFGIKHDGSGDQSQKMQAFLVEVVNTSLTGFIDPSTGSTGGANGINCVGASLYITQDGTRAQYKDMASALAGTNLKASNSNRAFGFRLVGASREYSILYNAVLCANPPGDERFTIQPVGGAGSGRLSNFRIYGGLDVWNLQGDSILDMVQVYYYLPTPRLYNDTLPWIDGFGLNVLGCNHLLLLDTAVYGTQNTGGSGAPLGGGLRGAGCTNLTMISGAVNNNLGGMQMTSIPYTAAAQQNGKSGNFVGQNSHLTVLGTHMEGNNYETLTLENITGAEISAHIRPYNWDANDYAAVRLGSAALGAARNVTLANSYFVRSVTAADTSAGYNDQTGTCVDLGNSIGTVVDDNNFSNFGLAIRGRSTTSQLDIRGSNTYLSCAKTVQIDAGCSFAPYDDPAISAPLALAPPSAAVGLNGNLTKSNAFAVSLSLATHTISPSNLQPGCTYVVEITKTVATAKIASWPANVLFAGPAPDLLAMTVGASAVFRLFFDGTNILATFAVLDATRPQNFSFRGPWTATTNYAAGDVVTQGGALFIAPGNFTSGAVFNAANWSVLVPVAGILTSSTATVTNGVVTGAAANIGTVVAIPTGANDVTFTLPPVQGVNDGASFQVVKQDTGTGRVLMMSADGATLIGRLYVQTDRVIFRYSSVTGAWGAHEVFIAPVLSDVFAAQGSFPWIKDPLAKYLQIDWVGPGMPAGSGATAPVGTAKSGGVSGVPGAVGSRRYRASKFGATETVTIPPPAPGGAAVTTAGTAGNAGTAPGAATFGTKVRAKTGAASPGAGGTNAAVTAAVPQAGITEVGAVAAASASSITAVPSSGGSGLVGAGGAGGGVTAGNVAFAGAGGGIGSQSSNATIAGGVGGAADSGSGATAGSTPADITDREFQWGGAGGGGGGASATGAGANGGNGSNPGGGGGGGGAGVTASGAGGAGGLAEFRVTSFF